MAHIAINHWYAGGEPEESVRQLEPLLPLIREAGDRADEATLLRSIARLHEWADNDDEALGCLHRSLAIFREVGDHDEADITEEDIQRVQSNAAELT